METTVTRIVYRAYLNAKIKICMCIERLPFVLSIRTEVVVATEHTLKDVARRMIDSVGHDNENSLLKVMYGRTQLRMNTYTM